MEEQKGCGCSQCAAREEEDKQQEDMNMAMLVALVPLLTMTLFSQIGML